MPELLFDGRQVRVPDGTNLVEAGLAADVPVPVFCYHRSLGAVGACRVCAVTATVGGRGRMVMACMTQAQEGMEVTTTDPASVSFRERVIEWLMLNHPHDCPICDEGGECQLQDLTVACGHSLRRYRGRKRTFRNQHLGEFIAHEMNRCITCWRCSRFYQEVAGGRDFGPTGSRDRVYFGRFEEGPLESPFSGNLVELCPTGVFTDKLFRYRSRVWDLDQQPSVCPHCSVGCNVLPGFRHRELQRVRVRENPEVNGVFLCDRGQFGHGWSMDSSRPRTPRWRGEDVDWEAALGAVAAELVAIASRDGPASVALLASPRAPLEAHASLRALAQGPLEGARAVHFDDPERETRSLAALAALGSAGAAPLDQADLGRCDVLLVAGASLLDEAPLAALGARQAARAGTRLFVLGPLERYLADVAERVTPAHPARLAGALGEVRARLEARAPERRREEAEDLALIAAALSGARRPGVLLGGDLMDGAAFAAGAALASALVARGSEARLGAIFPGPDGFGAALLSREPALGEVLRAIEAGEVRAAVLVESDLADLAPGMLDALARLELLVVADHVAQPLAERAHALLPAATSYESEGIFVNRAGRAQAFAAAGVPGIPVTRQIENATFPRTPRLAPPGSDPRPSWWILERLRERAIGRPAARGLAGVRAALAESLAVPELTSLRPGAPGISVAGAAAGRPAPRIADFEPPDGAMELFRVDRTLGSEPLSRRSEPMRRMAGPPVAWVSAPDAEAAGIAGAIRISVDGASVEMAAAPDASVPRGAVVIPRDVPWPRAPRQGARVEIRPASEGTP